MDTLSYRYKLERYWGPGKCAIWIMLNPSTADETNDDNTIRRVMQFSQDFGMGRLEVVNLYGLRCTDSTELFSYPDPVGPDNDAYIRGALERGDRGMVMVAWGSHPGIGPRVRAVHKMLEGYSPFCLKQNKDRNPRHPLYVKGGTDPTSYEWRVY